MTVTLLSELPTCHLKLNPAVTLSRSWWRLMQAVALSRRRGDALSHLDGWHLCVCVGCFWLSSVPKNSRDHDSDSGS